MTLESSPTTPEPTPKFSATGAAARPAPTVPTHLNTRYSQEIEVINLFARRLEAALSGSDDPVLINHLPIDMCHLGVLTPWQDPEVAQVTGTDQEAEETVDNTEVAEGEPEENAAVSTTARTPASTEVDPATSTPATDESPDDSPSPASVEAADDRTVARRPASSLGCELLLRPEGGRVKLRVNLSFAFYTAHLPTYAEQLRSLGGEYKAARPAPSSTSASAVARPEATETASPKQKRGGAPERAMTVAYTLRRQTLTLEGLEFDLNATRSADTVERARVQAELDRLILEALRDRPAHRETLATRSGAPLREEDLASEAAFEAALAKAVPRGEQQTRPHLRASLTVRTELQANGDVRVSLYLSNDTPMNTEQRTQNNVNILADAKLWGDVQCGQVRPIEILPVPRDYQYDRQVWGVGHNTSVTVDKDHGTFRTHALARFDQPRLTTKDHLPTEFHLFAEKPLESLAEIHQAMQDEVSKWRDEVLGKNTLKLAPDALAACEVDFDLFKGEVDRFAAGIAALKAQPALLKAFQGMNRTMSRIAAAKGFARWRLFQIAYIVTQLPALAIREGVSGGEDHLGEAHAWADDLQIADVLWFPTGGGKTESYLGLVCCAMLYDRLRGKRLGVTAWLRFPLRMLSVQQLQRAVTMVYEAQVELDAMDPKPDGDPLLLGYFVGSTTTPNNPNGEWFAQHATPTDLEPFRMVADCPKCGGKGTVRLIAKPDVLRLYHQCEACKTHLPLVITDSEIYRTLPAMIVGTVDKAATLGMQEKFGILWAGPKWKCTVKGHGYGNTDFCLFECKKGTKRETILPYDPSPSLHIQDELHLLQEELGAFAGHYETLIRYCEAQVPDSHPAKVIAATATIEGFEHQARHLYGVKGARRFPSRGYQRHENFYARIDQEGGQDKTARVFLAFRPGGMSTDAASRCAKILGETSTRLFTNETSALASLSETATPDELAALRHYYAMTLTYVGSLTSGTRVNDALKEAGSTILQAQRTIETEYLNARSTAGDIAAVIDRIETPPQWTDSKHIDALVATNMISHGVDLERCNLMVMEKYPAETAEYIQASSRSGRKKVGLVVVVLPARNLRAASIYNRFSEYHRHLDRMVTPVPVNRFAKQAIRRTISGTVSGLIYGIGVPQEGGKSRLKELTGALTWLEHDKLKRTRAHLRGAQALGQGNYDPDLEAAQAALVDETFDELLARLRQQRVVAGSSKLGDALNPKPMTSLRDVERPVPFWPINTEYDKLQWFKRGKA